MVEMKCPECSHINRVEEEIKPDKNVDYYTKCERCNVMFLYRVKIEYIPTGLVMRYSLKR